MSIRAKILLKDRTVAIKKLNPKRSWFRYRDGIYSIDRRLVNNVLRNKRIERAEIIYFEANPNPVPSVKPTKTPEKREDFKQDVKYEDRSIEFLGELVIENVLEQTSLGPAIDFGKIMDSLRWLFDLKTLTTIILMMVLAYGILVGGL